MDRLWKQPLFSLSFKPTFIRTKKNHFALSITSMDMYLIVKLLKQDMWLSLARTSILLIAILRTREHNLPRFVFWLALHNSQYLRKIENNRGLLAALKTKPNKLSPKYKCCAINYSLSIQPSMCSIKLNSKSINT